MLAADCTGVYLFPRPLKRLRKRIYRNQSLEIINEWTSFQSHGFSPSVYLAGHTYKKINTRFDIEGPAGVLLLNMVDNSRSLSEPISGRFFVSVQSGEAISPWNEAPSGCFCWGLHQLPLNTTLLPHQACKALKRKPLAMGK